MLEEIGNPVCGCCGRFLTNIETLVATGEEVYCCICRRNYKKKDYSSVCCDLCFSPLVYVGLNKVLCSNIQCPSYRITSGGNSHVLFYKDKNVGTYPKKWEGRKVLSKSEDFYAKILVNVWNYTFPNSKIS